MKLTTFLDELKKEAEEKRNEDRKRLLAVSELDSYKLSLEDWYQRIRYQREEEASQWMIAQNNHASIIKKTCIEYRSD